MQTQTFSEQSLIEKIHTLPPEKVSEEKAQDAADVAEVRSRQAHADPAQRRTLDDLRQAWGQ